MIGILLAAGFSTRFGEADKLTQPLADGAWLAVHAGRRLIDVVPHSVAVVRAQQTALKAALLTLGFDVVVCPASAKTMADSLVCALHTASKHPAAQGGYLVALGDMPSIQASTIASVTQAIAAGAWIARPSYHGQAGHPVGFAAALLPVLCQVEGDQGARQVIQQHAAHVVTLACDDAGCVYDIDVPADLTALITMPQKEAD